MRNILKPRWLTEMIAVWGYVQRNYYLTKRYFMWEIVWLVYVTVNACYYEQAGRRRPWGQQVSYIVSSLLLLVSGVYYPVEVLPDWMKAIATVSPVTYALNGARDALLDGAGLAQLWTSIAPLLVMGLVFVPLGLLIFRAGERYAKRTGKLKRSG
ncbi:MAG: ABC transporter permease [Actinomycetota bacterium]|nr:ABC transporter permease [Actinomycetota bacterium]